MTGRIRFAGRVLSAATVLILPGLAAAQPCAGPAPAFDPARPITQQGSLPAEGRDRRRVLLSLSPRCTAAAAAAIERADGIIEYRVDELGYLRFRLGGFPLDRLARLPGVEAIFIAPRFSEMGANLMGSLPLRQGARGDIEALPEGRTRMLPAGLPYDNPYTLAAGIGAERFIAADPRHDGRGVTVAVIDAGFDPAMPALQEARDRDGRSVRKIAAIRTSADPRVVGTGRGWVNMPNVVESATREAIWEGRPLRLPGPGRYRIGALTEDSGTGHINLAGDLDGDGNPPGRDGPFIVLWREEDARVWVDTNRDGDLSDERALTEFDVNGDFAFYRPVSLSPTRAGPTAFVVQIDRSNRAVALLSGGSHDAMSASSAVGSRFFGGDAGGVAPGARLVGISHGSGSSRANTESEATLYNGIEALLMALADPRVDVVSYYPPSEWMRNDGRSVFERITRRAVRHYGKPVLSAVGNSGPALNNVVHSTDEAIAVGAFTSRASLAANTGMQVEGEGIIHPYSARGPADDGASSPSIVAPTGFVVADKSYGRPRRTSNESVGYQLGSGTSQATPTAAGAAALLVGAARLAGIAHDHGRIASAFLSSARRIEGYGAHEQGAGLIDVPAAWQVLQRLREAPPEFRVAGPVATRASRLGATPTVGRGLYEQEGWQAGQAGVRALTIERLSGARASRRYRIELRGNDGTFSAAGEVRLARGRPVSLPVRIAPRDAGVHSALLRLIDPATDAVAHQTLLTIVAAERLVPSGAPIVRDLRVSYMRPRSIFVAVPDNVPSLIVRATGPRVRSEVGVRAPGPRVPTTGSCSERPLDAERKLMTCTVPQPVAGTWEIYADWPVELSPEGPFMPDATGTREVRIEVEAGDTTG